MTHRAADIVVASLGLFTWPVYVRSYCVPIATLNQNKPSLLLYLGHAQIIMNYIYHGIFHNNSNNSLRTIDKKSKRYRPMYMIVEVISGDV